jgi:hypothetical protein
LTFNKVRSIFKAKRDDIMFEVPEAEIALIMLSLIMIFTYAVYSYGKSKAR